MTADLEDRATAEMATCQQRLTVAQAGLKVAHDELDLRVADPAAVPPAQRRNQLGAAQHLTQATLDDVTLRADEGDLRAKLAGIPTPDAADPVVADLKANLVAQAAARVELRAATERAGLARAAVNRAAAAIAAADNACRAASSVLAAATVRQQQLTDLIASLTAAPLATVVADAAAVRAGPVHTAAATRVAALLPPALLTRSAERHAESSEPLDRALTAAAHATSRAGTLATGSGDPDAALAVAGATLDGAQDQLRAYASTAPDRLARATALLTPLATLPDLDASVIASLDQTAPGRADALAALSKEKALADAYRAFAVLDQAVGDARLTALADDPDRDPAGVQAVIDAIAARDDPAVKDPLAAARAAYDAAAEGALDAWEVEVPAWLWAAVQDLHDATSTLDDLSDGAARTALLTGLNPAIDSYASAADAAAVAGRVRWVVADAVGGATSGAGVLAGTSGQRVSGYVRGDALGGRHDRES